MLVYFPGGITANVPQDTIALGAYGTSAYPPTINRAGLMGDVTAGTMNPYLTRTFGVLLVQTDGGTTKVWVRFLNQANAATAYNNIGVALGDGNAAILFAADGTYTVL